MKIKRSRIQELIKEEFENFLYEGAVPKKIKVGKDVYFLTRNKVGWYWKAKDGGVLDVINSPYLVPYKDPLRLWKDTKKRFHRDLVNPLHVIENKLNEVLDKKDYAEIKDLIRAEVAAIFWDLFKKRQMWV